MLILFRGWEMEQKPGYVSVHLNPSGEDFRLLSPSSGESLVKFYQYRSKDCYRFFCDKCGVQVWDRGEYTLDDEHHVFFSVNMNTVDQPQDGLDVSQLKIDYLDGLTDNFGAGLRDKPFPGGMA